MIRHLCASFGLEVPVELATIDPQAAAADSHSHASGSKSRSSGPVRMVKSFSFARKSRSKHEKASTAGASASASSAHSKAHSNSSASSSMSATTPKASSGALCAGLGSAGTMGRSAGAGAVAKQELMDVDERGRSDHEASALKVAGVRAESGESGVEGDEGEPEPDAGDAEADNAEADGDGGDEPELDVGMNASLGDAEFCTSPGPSAGEEDASHLDSTQLELIEKLKKRQYETNLNGQKTFTAVSASDRLMKELKEVFQSDVVRVQRAFTAELMGDNLFDWVIKINKLDPDSKLAADLANYASRNPAKEPCVRLSFPHSYPFDPPFVRVIEHEGSHTHSESSCTAFRLRVYIIRTH